MYLILGVYVDNEFFLSALHVAKIAPLYKRCKTGVLSDFPTVLVYMTFIHLFEKQDGHVVCYAPGVLPSVFPFIRLKLFLPDNSSYRLHRIKLKLGV